MACIFCKIVSGEIPSNKVYEDDLVIAVLDIYPITPGHTLVVPKQHHELVSDLPAETMASMAQAAQKVEKALRASSVRCDASNLVINNGRTAGQEIPHVHLHVIPRFRGDGVRFYVDQKKASREELEAITGELLEKLALPGETPTKN